MVYLFIALLLSVAYGSRTVNVTVINCTSADAEGTINTLTITPPPPEQTDKNFTITGTGKNKEDVNDGIFKAITTVRGFPIYETEGDLCKPDHIVMPGGMGDIYFEGVKCPVKTGQPLVDPITVYISD
eukprot:UN08169